MAATEFDEAGQHALAATMEWTKMSTGLAVGALVFGLGLIAPASEIPAIRVPLCIAWFCFGLAVIGGIFAQASLPVLMSEKKYSLEDSHFTYPARVHQLAFFLGTGLLVYSLFLVMYQPERNLGAAHSAWKASILAESALPSQLSISKVAVVEVVGTRLHEKGFEGMWHFQYAGMIGDSQSGPTRVFDVYVDVQTGATRAVQKSIRDK